jgi:pentatricopeptide repeat protein
MNFYILIMEEQIMLQNKTVISLFLISLLAVSFGGCVMTGSKEDLIRSGNADLQTGNYKLADKKGKKILRSWENNHQAMLLRAKSAYSQGDDNKAIEILTQMDHLCRKDFCPNETSHIEGMILLASLTNDEELIRKSQDNIDELKRNLSVQQYSTLIDYYIEQGRPNDAAATFDKLMVSSDGKLTSEQKMKGFVLYYSVFEMEMAKELYSELPPNQKVQVKRQFGDIQF